VLNKAQLRSRSLALRALRDCVIIRVTIGQVPLGYRLLQREGLVRATRVVDNPDKADVRLTPAGLIEEVTL
jgi:hypothetical protein